ncbi:hypothetical protein SOVF_070070 [Spinacia oleracea]|uniref:NAC domain-containing protein 82 n=1 Tax=Spinacia oleracea TaxID=3562 RepID=A0A9R0J8T0_SPIOL|nr:NAC domain-containing protein 82 [Spinacia oleracea]KNA18491.1 hypothetical protein SOVF_070070 [Spinacia oleracea]
MKGLLGRKSFPPGFRFHPTDEELFMFYLKRKVMGKSLGPQMIAEVDVYRFAPWDLPSMACLKTRDLNWYFFCPRAKKYPNGGRANRATEWGYWKSTGNDRTVMYSSRPVGKIKTLVFHRGKAPKGERTDWVMHEFRLEDKLLTEKGVPQESYVICKVFEKSGLGPKNGESYGARFVEEEWDSDDDDNAQETDYGLVVHDTGCGRGGDSPDVSVLTSSLGAPNVTSSVHTPIPLAVCAAANAASPNSAATNAASPNSAATNAASPTSTVTNLVSATSAAAFMGDPFTTAASMGTHYVTDLSMDMQNAAPASVSMLNVDDCSGSGSGSGSGLLNVADCSGLGSGLAIDAMTEEDVDRLLMHFTENDEATGDIYSGLGDLFDPSALNIDWSDLADPSAAENGDWGDCFIEMNDLN